MLKLNPANFLEKLAEFFYQYVDISYHFFVLLCIVKIRNEIKYTL